MRFSMRARASGDLGVLVDTASEANREFAEKVAAETARLARERDNTLEVLATNAEVAGQRTAEAIRAMKGAA